jgi:hypothetical protein
LDYFYKDTISLSNKGKSFRFDIQSALAVHNYDTHKIIGEQSVDKPSLKTPFCPKVTGRGSAQQRRITKLPREPSFENSQGPPTIRHLSLEGEAGANLVGGLVQVLGIERGTQAEGDTRAEENVVSQSGDTTVVDLGLFVYYS